MANAPLAISSSGGLKELPLVTSIGATGSDTAIPTEQATREAITEPLADMDRCGFVSHAQTGVSFSDSTYIFTLTDTGSGWQYYRTGVLCTISGNKTVTLAGSPPTAGVYFVYIDATDGTLMASLTAWTLTDSKIPVAIIIWNSANTPKYWLCDERHTCLIDRRAHLYLHSTRGTQLVSGATLSGLSVKPSSPADTDNTPAIAAATLADEDLYLSLATLAEGNGTSTDYSVWFKASGAWTWEASAMPYRYTAAGYIQYDNAGTMTQGAASKYYNWYLVCTNVSGAGRFGWFPGKGEFSAQADAYAENPANFDWSGIPLAESVVVWQVTWETSNSYATKGKCRLNRTPQRVNLTVTTAINQSNLAAGVATDTTNFGSVLSAADTTVQRALDTLDNHTHASVPINQNLFFDYKNASTVTVRAGGVAVSGSVIHTIANATDVTFANLDTGAEAANTLYYVWVGTSGGATALKISASATAPTGLTNAVRYAGVIRNDNSSNILPFLVANGFYQYVVSIDVAGSDVTEVYDGSLGTTFVSVSCAGFAPPSCRACIIVLAASYRIAWRPAESSTTGVVGVGYGEGIFYPILSASATFEVKCFSTQTTRLSVAGFYL